MLTKCLQSLTRKATLFLHLTLTLEQRKSVHSLLFASLCYLQFDRCKFFWFFCRDVQKFEEPDDPNKCPYKTKELYLEHIQAQPEWREWRAAPLEERRRLARQIAKRFHPDKYVVNTSSCRHCIFVPIFLYSIWFAWHSVRCRRWDQFNPVCDHYHKEKWAEYIAKKVIELMMKDRQEWLQRQHWLCSVLCERRPCTNTKAAIAHHSKSEAYWICFRHVRADTMWWIRSTAKSNVCSSSCLQHPVTPFDRKRNFWQCFAKHMKLQTQHIIKWSSASTSASLR